MIIALCSTRNWYHYLLVNIFTILSTNKVKKIYLFIEDDNISELKKISKFKTKIVICNYHKLIDKYIGKNINMHTSYGMATLIRLLLSKFIQEDKAIYIDVDALVIGDISSLWNIYLDKYFIAGVKDSNVINYLDYLDKLKLDENNYVNAGVLLLNLKLIKKLSLDEKFISLLNERKYKFPDQDILNIVCKNKILFIDNCYNSSIVTGYSLAPKIIHYASYKKYWVKGHKYDYIWYDWEKRYSQYDENLLNNDDIEIDLIIPVYNSRKYLKRALDSVAIQSIKNKILVTIVNDGSKEKYDDILAKYNEKLKINYIEYKKNKGPGRARQIGLENTNLPYIMFLDSDDMFFDDLSAERLYNIMKCNSKAKVVMGRETDGFKEQLSYISLYGKIYLRDGLNNIKFLYDKSHEDICFNFEVFSVLEEIEVEKLDCIVVIHTNDNKNSITHTSNLYQKNVKSLENIIKRCKYQKLKNWYIILFLKSLYIYCITYNFENEQQRTRYYKLVFKFYSKVCNLINYKLFSEYNENKDLLDFYNMIKYY